MASQLSDTVAEVHPEDRDLIEKLAKLQDIHNQMNELRGLMPDRLLKPARTAVDDPSKSSPEKLAADLSKIVSQGSTELKLFKKGFRGDDMQDLWQKTSSSSFPQGCDAWSVDYQALLESSMTGTSAVALKNDSNGVKTTTITEDTLAIITRFRENNANLRMEIHDDTTIFPINVWVSSMPLEVVSADRDVSQAYEVRAQVGQQQSAVMNDVLACVREAKVHGDLGALLDMLASYRDLKSRACGRCSKLFDDDMAYPTIRRRRALKDEKDMTNNWDALHQGCP